MSKCLEKVCAFNILDNKTWILVENLVKQKCQELRDRTVLQQLKKKMVGDLPDISTLNQQVKLTFNIKFTTDNWKKKQLIFL